MKPILATALVVATVVAATAASSQLLKAQPKANAPAAQPKAGAAPAAQPNIIVMGAGLQTCAQWLTNRAQGGALADAEIMWVAGYLSALNHTGIDPTRNISNGANAGQIANAVDQDCRTRPTATVDTVLWIGIGTLLRGKGYDTASLGNAAPLPKLR